jgi:hypothetical protein
LTPFPVTCQIREFLISFISFLSKPDLPIF